jgi:hypothetical protein
MCGLVHFSVISVTHIVSSLCLLSRHFVSNMFILAGSHSVQADDSERSDTWLVYTHLMVHLQNNKARGMTLHQYGSQEFGLSCPLKEGMEGFLHKQTAV